jgi:hypothetical protein
MSRNACALSATQWKAKTFVISTLYVVMATVVYSAMLWQHVRNTRACNPHGTYGAYNPCGSSCLAQVAYYNRRITPEFFRL